MNQREIIQKLVNTLKPEAPGSAPITIGCPSRLHAADISVFKKLPGEKEQLINLKAKLKKKKLELVGRYIF